MNLSFPKVGRIVDSGSDFDNLAAGKGHICRRNRLEISVLGVYCGVESGLLSFNCVTIFLSGVVAVVVVPKNTPQHGKVPLRKSPGLL